MLADSDRLLQTVEQVLRAGQSGQRRRKHQPAKDRCRRDGARMRRSHALRYNLGPESVSYTESLNGERPQVKADADELRAAISNLLDNAVKYSVKDVQVSVEVAALDDKKVAVRIADTASEFRPRS